GVAAHRQRAHQRLEQLGARRIAIAVPDGVEDFIAEHADGPGEIVDVAGHDHHSVVPRASHGWLGATMVANLRSSSARLRSARATGSRSSPVTAWTSRSRSLNGPTASRTRPVVAPTRRWWAVLSARSTRTRRAGAIRSWWALEAARMRAS